MGAQAVEALLTDTEGIYVDATFGGGGHSRLVLSLLGVNGRLIAFDQDADAQANVPDDPRFTLVPQNFRHLRAALSFIGIRQVHGVLADLGVSSHQLDTASRGFSFRFDAPLDMRMDHGAKRSAVEVVNTYTEEQLERLFKNYGELRQARAIARLLVAARAQAELSTTSQLQEVLRSMAPPDKRASLMARIFQAIRIEVNDELGALQALLEQMPKVLQPGGRLVVISYHSLEDRLTKRFMQSGNFEGVLEKDFYGNLRRPFTPCKGMPVVPNSEELKANNRSRSAKLRVAVRNEE